MHFLNINDMIVANAKQTKQKYFEGLKSEYENF